MGYFQKQGFTKEILLEREKWGGYIKARPGALPGRLPGKPP